MLSRDDVRKIFMGKSFSTDCDDVKLAEDLELIRKKGLDAALEETSTVEVLKIASATEMLMLWQRTLAFSESVPWLIAR